jgi:CHAD domain-containing protein
MADSKWISNLKPDMPLMDAARHVLFVRLQLVRDFLPRVLHHADDDPEHVHQLRVATRRADAALRIFQNCMPDKVYKASRRRLRRLRRSAGATRDWDVFLMDLRQRLKRNNSKDRPGLDFLLGYALGQRTSAVSELLLTVENQVLEFELFLTDVVASVRVAADNGHVPTLLGLGRVVLAQRRQELEVTASGDLTDYPHLHRVRIAGKRLRYAMEVFADCFPPAFREVLYPLVEEMQEILGRANDSHVASDRLAGLRHWLKQRWPGDWDPLKPGLEKLLHFHQRRLPQERRRFLEWWERWSHSGSEELLLSIIPVAG